MTGFTDHQAAARAGVDQSARQSGYPLWPKGAMDMDVDRHEVACSENWARPSESWGRKRIVCGDCRKLLIAGSWRELKALMAEHLDG